MITQIKTILGSDADDAVIRALQDQVKKEVMAYCGYVTYDEALDPAVFEMTIIKYRKRGSEHLGAHSYSGASESFQEDYPPSVLRLLNRHRRACFR